MNPDKIEIEFSEDGSAIVKASNISPANRVNAESFMDHYCPDISS